MAVVCMLALASPSWARLAPFDGIGGAGGAPYRLDCGKSPVLVGVTGQSGLVIDRLAGLCVKIDPVSGTWVGDVYETTATGGTGGSRFHKACPVGQALVGLEGTIKYFSGTNVVASLGINCTELKIRTEVQPPVISQSKQLTAGVPSPQIAGAITQKSPGIAAALALPSARKQTILTIQPDIQIQQNLLIQPNLQRFQTP